MYMSSIIWSECLYAHSKKYLTSTSKIDTCNYFFCKKAQAKNKIKSQDEIQWHDYTPKYSPSD